MSPASKRLKISCIVCIFMGLFVFACGVRVILSDVSDPALYLTSVAGLSTTGLGVMAARLANVPSNAKRIMALAAAATVIALLCCLIQALTSTRAMPLGVVADGVAAVCSVAVVVCARIVQRLEEIVS